MRFGKPISLFAFFVVIAASLFSNIGIQAGELQFDWPTTDVGMRQAIEDGVGLERSHRWFDAIELYEGALELWPENKQLKYGLRRSKIHFSVERRYSDTSFRSSLLRMSQSKALDLFDELFSKIQSHYVDQISSTSFVAHGTESLYLSLANEKFLEQNLQNPDPQRVQRMRQILRKQYWNKTVNGSSEARNVINQVCDKAHSLLGLSGGSVVMEYIFGGCNALDDYSSCLTPHSLDDLYNNIEGEFVGLGIEMKAEAGQGMKLVNVLPESPAAEGGLMPGDFIVGIDGINCREMSTDEAAELLRGLPGSRVHLEIQTPTDTSTRQLTLARRSVQVKSIPVIDLIDEEQGIGYIRMTGFQKTSPEELDAALKELRQRGMQALIWDLRGNPGGLLTAAVEVLDRFIDDGVLVSTKGRTSDQNWTYSAHRLGTSDLPLILLVDGESASASEIVAGALHDHQRAAIVGRKTYGKWSVQSIFPILYSTGLRLTTAKFYSPKGRTLGKVGVKPDVLVEEAPDKRATFYRRPSDIDPSHDADLQKALELLHRRLVQR